MLPTKISGDTNPIHIAAGRLIRALRVLCCNTLLMRRCQHPLFALLLSLLLISSQQAALAHMLGHVVALTAALAATEVVQGEDPEHDAALVLSHVCTTCIAFAGADLAPPAPLAPPAITADTTAAPAVTVPPAPTLAVRAAFRSRAPPLL